MHRFCSENHIHFSLDVDDLYSISKVKVYPFINLMPEETSIEDLDPRLQKQLDNAEKAIGKGNPSYAVDVCTEVLKRHPECLEVRKLLRRAQINLTAGRSKGMTRFFSKVTSAPFMMKSDSLVEKDPVSAMEQAEKLINSNAANTAAHRLLGKAATKVGYPETAVFAYQTALEFAPDSVDISIALADALIAAKRAKEAIVIGDKLLKKNPALSAAQELIRRASVAVSMEKGKWEGDSSFRENLADEDEAVRLEQASRVANDEETLQKLIADLKHKIEVQPENINYYRDIARNYRKLGQFDSALEWVGRARKQPSGRSDTTLERLEADLRNKAVEAKLGEIETQLAENPEDEGLKKQLADLRRENLGVRLKSAADLVERYPNDYAARFDYGVLLLESGEIDSAIEQFQKSQRNPKVRLRSLLYLGRAYKAKRFYDMAVDQLASAKKELTVMDDLKKETIYELAGAYEGMGKMNEAIEEYKVIYANDIGYRDVADKINHFYESKGD